MNEKMWLAEIAASEKILDDWDEHERAMHAALGYEGPTIKERIKARMAEGELHGSQPLIEKSKGNQRKSK